MFSSRLLHQSSKIVSVTINMRRRDCFKGFKYVNLMLPIVLMTIVIYLYAMEKSTIMVYNWVYFLFYSVFFVAIYASCCGEPSWRAPVGKSYMSVNEVYILLLHIPYHILVFFRKHRMEGYNIVRLGNRVSAIISKFIGTGQEVIQRRQLFDLSRGPRGAPGWQYLMTTDPAW